MSPASTHSQNSALPSDPLLHPKLQKDHPHDPITPTANTAIKSLAILRIAIGAACIFTPRLFFGVFKINVSNDMAMLSRMFGGRDLVLGELLYTAEDKSAADRGRREIRRVLWGGVVADVVDIASVGVAFATGSMGVLSAGLGAGTAAVGLGLGVLGLRGL